MNLSEALHIVSGDSAAGTLRVAHHLRRDRVLVNEDPISVGPATFSGDLGSWRESRERFVAELYLDWPDFSLDHYSENGLLANAHRLGESVDKVIWAGAGLADQLSIAWVLALARHFGVDESRLYVVQFERLGTGQVVLSAASSRPRQGF